MKASKMKFTKEKYESIKTYSPTLLLRQCYGCCADRTHLLPCSVSNTSTRFYNLSDCHVELQIRVSSILKRVHTLKPRRSKKLKHSSIQRAYVGDQEGRRWLYNDDTCLTYVWVHETGADLSKMVKQQYVSLEDLRVTQRLDFLRTYKEVVPLLRKEIELLLDVNSPNSSLC